jgi:hypothetical protein
MDWVEVKEGGGVIVSSAVAWRLRRGLGIFAVVEECEKVRGVDCCGNKYFGWRCDFGNFDGHSQNLGTGGTSVIAFVGMSFASVIRTLSDSFVTCASAFWFL